MKEYQEAILSFIESAEMRDYLRMHFHELSGYLFAQIVIHAPAPLEKKIPALDIIASQSGYAGEFDNPAKMAAQCRTALAERYDNPPGTVFWLQPYLYNEEDCYFDVTFFTDFDAAVRQIESKQQSKWKLGDQHDLWHIIEKIIPSENGAMIERCMWILDYRGEIWYFEYFEQKPEDWEPLYDCIGNSPNLPIPFQSGDIVLADCRPFAEERRVVIVEIGDNCDCCAVQCLYALPGGRLNIGAFKHNAFFYGTKEKSCVSALCRAAVWKGELAENEAPLAIVAAALKANPQLSREIDDFISHTPQRPKRGEWGVTWERLKDAFNL